MTGVLTRYIARLLLVRVAALLVALGALLILLDFLADGDQVLAAGQGTVVPILRYIGLRLPDTVSALIPIAALLASLLGFAELARYQELTVIFSAGISRLRLVLAALPVALMIAGLQFVVEDQAMPFAAAELRHWGIGDYEPDDRNAFTWIRLGNDMVRYRRLAGDAPRLAEVTIHRRDSTGALIETIAADEATHKSGGWVLYNVRRFTGKRQTVERLDRLFWTRGPDPSLLADANTPPASRSFADLATIVARSGLGDYPLYMYRLALNERLMRPVMTILLVVLGVALARPLPQRASIGILITIGATLGILCWMAGEFLASIGELGLLPPLVAAWSPAAIAAFVVAFAALLDRPSAN